MPRGYSVVGMELTRTSELLPRVIWRESSSSTNAELRELARAAAAPLPDGTMLVTSDQTAGRGRLDRGWVTIPGQSLAVSVLLRHDAGELGVSWMPLLVGSAMSAALQRRFGAGLRVGVKWPNDVHVRDEADAIAGRPGLKLCGILCELLPDGAVIAGTGINFLIPEEELPTGRATSLLAAGADVNGATNLFEPAGSELVDAILWDYVTELRELLELAATRPGAARARVARHSLTLGTEVRVHLAGDETVDGRACALADDGALVVERPTGGVLTVSAGDVEHLR
ncbi:BirA family biotin operon repressor/biotin-[acetyl-CoA-carboxylase] ligase [Leucobacter luti]|nr:BirA family biotin operon repressor/biotin-[acetyl-CoA-carboxylase] ligase [Leucobacter luti]